MAGAQAEAGTIDATIVGEAGRALAMAATDAPAGRRRWAWHRVLWIVAALAVLVLGGLRVAAMQPVTVPPLPAAAPPFPQGAGLQPQPVPDPSELPPDPPPPPDRPVALPSFGPQ
jgi:hypothetical protein